MARSPLSKPLSRSFVEAGLTASETRSGIVILERNPLTAFFGGAGSVLNPGDNMPNRTACLRRAGHVVASWWQTLPTFDR
jgi:hypothetical protein